MAYNHHLLPLADYLYKLYKSQSLCDLSIITKNGTTVLAHKLVVAAFSGAVRTEVEKWKDLPQVSIVVDCETAVLTEILDFVYIGNCHLHKELFPLLRQASHTLQIPSLQKYLKEKGPTSRKSLQINHSEAKQKKETKALPNVENLRSRRNIKPKKAYHDEQFEWSGDLREPGDDIPTADDNDDNDGDALWEEEVRNEPRTSRRKGKPGKPDKLINQAYVRLERIDASVKQQSLNTTLRSTVTDKATRHTVNKSLIPVKERKNKYTRENLTNLAKEKRTRNKKRNPLMNHSKHSIENIKHSMNNWKKTPAELLAWKCKKLYEKHHKDIGVKRVGYSCKICKVWHKNISHIKFHINLKHRNIQPKRRKFANKKKKKGSFEERKKKIERIKQKIKNCECFRCDRTYKLVRGLATHLVEKHKISFERAQKLTGYPKYFKYQNLTRHTCDECKMEFNTLKDFRAHCRIVHKKKRLDPDMTCTYKKCSQKFLSMAKLKEHLLKFHKQKNVSIKCRQGRVSARVDKQDITTRLQKQRRLLEDLSVSSKEEQVKRKKEESFIKQINELSEITDSKSSSYQKKKIKYNVVLPSKKYRCNRCPKSSVCRNKLIHKNHREIRHKKILVSKVFESQLVLKKHICQSFSCVKFVNRDSNDLTLKSKGDVPNMTNAIHSGVPRQKPNVLEQKEVSTYVGALGHFIASKHNSIDFLPFQAPNTTGQFGGYLSLLQDSSLNEQSGLFEFSNTCNIDSPCSLQNQSDGKLKRCKRNQFTCLKCGLSFHYYSSASLHFKKRHQKHHLGQRTIFSSLKKHVNLRSVLFSRKSFLKTSTFQLQFAEERSTTCEICEKTFSHVRSLARHLQNTHRCTFEQTRNTTGYPSKIAKKKEEITCVDCKKTFTNIRNLATHLQNVHKYTFEQAREATGYPAFTRVTALTKKKKTKCEKCLEIFETMKDFRVHEVVIHGLPCKYCSEKFLHLVSLKKHGVRDHPEHFEEFEEMKATSKAWILDEDENENTEDENYKCDNCDYSTRKLNFLTVHVMEVHPEVQHHCPTCGYSFRSQYSVDLHTSKHHGEAEKKKPVCIFCSKKFLRKRFLRIHQFKAHGILHPDVKQYKCEVEGCSKIAYTATELRQHKRNHTAEKRFPCQQCSFVCAHRHRLLRHVRTVHLQLKPALCESCGKSFTTEQHMKEHIRRYHTNDYYELQCDYCSFQCGVRNQLQTHVWNQHQMKMAGDSRQYYQCDRCPYQTPLKCKFNNHMNGHNNIRNYVCDQCDSRFVTSSTLRTHKQWKHSSKEEDKICSHCGYKTKTSNKLNEHIRVQHQLKGVKPYHCSYCDFKCATGGNCRKHIMAKHKDVPVHYTCDTEYLEIARMARKEGNTNPLIVHTANDTLSDNQIVQSPATFTQIVPNFEQLPPADHLMFDPVRYEKL